MSVARYETMKSSGIEWVGLVPSHWVCTRVKHVCSFSTGWTPPTGDSSSYEGANLWANISDLGLRTITDTAKRISDAAVTKAGLKVAQKGSLLFSFKLSIGRVSFAGIEMYTNEAIATFPPCSTLDLRFAYYALPLFLRENASENIYGAKLLNQELIRSAAITLPPPSEQSAIATFLDRETAKIDAMVSEQKKLVELLEEKRKAVISRAVTEGLDPNMPMKDSGVDWLGRVPHHWKVSQLRRLAREGTSITYGIVQAGPDVDDGIPYIRTSDMSGSSLPQEGYLRTSPEIDAAYARSKVTAGDVVIAIRATIGKPLIVPTYLEGANLTQGTAKFSPGPDVISEFVCLFLRSLQAVGHFERLAKGVTFKEITLEMLRKFNFLVPPLAEQHRIVQFVAGLAERLDCLIIAAEQSIALLQERRRALIASTVTGKIDVRGLIGAEAEAA